MPFINSIERVGYDRGQQEGREEERRAIAQNMLHEGISFDLIAKVTGLTLEQIQKLRSEPISE